jgi:hypothetical protein
MNQPPVDNLKQHIHGMVQSYLVEWVANIVLSLDSELTDPATKQQVFNTIEKHIPSPVTLHQQLDQHALQTSSMTLQQIPIRYLKCHGNTSHITHNTKLGQQLQHEIETGNIPKKVRSRYKSTPLLSLATQLATNKVAGGSTKTTGNIVKQTPECIISTSDEEPSESEMESWEISDNSLRDLIVDSEGNVITDHTISPGDIQHYLWDVETNAVFQETDSDSGEYVGTYCSEQQKVTWYHG